MTEATFQWEDDGVALLSTLDCKCGHVIEVDEIVDTWDNCTVRCPKCGREYKFIWLGMKAEEVKNEKTGTN